LLACCAQLVAAAKVDVARVCCSAASSCLVNAAHLDTVTSVTGIAFTFVGTRACIHT